MKLHHKLYLFFAAVVLVPLLVATVASAIMLRRAGTETYEARIQSAITASTALISEQTDALASDLEGAVSDDYAAAVFKRPDENMRTGVLEALAAAGGFDGALLTDSAGVVLASAGETGEEGAAKMLASVKLESPGGEELTISATRAFDQEALGRIFAAQDLGWALVDEDGSVTAGSFEQGSRIEGLPASPTMDQGGEGTLVLDSFDVVVDDDKLLAAALALPEEITSGPVVILSGVSRSAAVAAANSAIWAGVATMVVVAILAGVLGWLLARTITRPLRDLSSTIAEAEEGIVGGDDELGAIAETFGSMQSSMRNYISELEESKTQLLLALSYTGEILGSTTDRNRLIKTTAEAARLATGASGVWVELFDTKQSAGHKPVSTAVPYDYFSNDLGNQARRLALAVAEGRVPTGEMQSLNNGTEAVAFPLLHDRKVLGSLLAAFDEKHPPEESANRILGSLAAQAASAVENIYFGELQQHMAITDPMTGLYNFRYIYDFIDLELSKCRRHGRAMSVCIMDLDDFKSVNDNYGHQAGDALLKAIAAVLSEGVRGADMVARYGGEEFVIVLPETSKKDAMMIAEKLREGIARTSLDDYENVKTTASIGVATYPEDAEDTPGLLGKADEALYRAKATGKNRSVSA